MNASSTQSFAFLALMVTLGASGCESTGGRRIAPGVPDSSGPTIIIISDELGVMRPGDSYTLARWNTYHFHALAWDSGSGIASIVADVTWEVECEGSTARGTVRDRDAFSAVNSRVRPIGYLDPLVIVPTGLVANACPPGDRVGELRQGLLTIVAENHAGKSSRSVYRLEPDVCGELGRRCCENVPSCMPQLECHAYQGGIELCGVPCHFGASCIAADATGECARGTIVCHVDHTLCQPGLPGAERCNGLDDDCDGFVDEGMEATDLCNGMDDDCDGETDEDFSPEACTTVASGCTSIVLEGDTECVDGKLNCVADEGSICAECDGNNRCGMCFTAPCTPGGPVRCAPDLTCGIAEGIAAPPHDVCHCAGRDYREGNVCAQSCWAAVE